MIFILIIAIVGYLIAFGDKEIEIGYCYPRGLVFHTFFFLLVSAEHTPRGQRDSMIRLLTNTIHQ